MKKLENKIYLLTQKLSQLSASFKDPHNGGEFLVIFADDFDSIVDDINKTMERFASRPKNTK